MGKLPQKHQNATEANKIRLDKSQSNDNASALVYLKEARSETYTTHIVTIKSFHYNATLMILGIIILAILKILFQKVLHWIDIIYVYHVQWWILTLSKEPVQTVFANKSLQNPIKSDQCVFDKLVVGWLADGWVWAWTLIFVLKYTGNS